MRFFMIFSLSLLFFSIVFVDSVRADYMVNNLAVDAEGKTVIEAKDKAFVQARANAFQIISKRLLGEEGSANIQTPHDSVISTMVNSFEINREKTSKNRYLASINVAFNEPMLQAYLTQLTAVNTMSGGFETRQTATSDYRMNQADARPMTASTVKVDFFGFSQWIELKQTIQSMRGVHNIAIDRLQTSGAIITISHHGTINELQGEFVQKGLKLYNNRSAERAIATYLLLKTG